MSKIKDIDTFHTVAEEDFEKTLVAEILSGEHSIELATSCNTAYLICETQLAALESFHEENRDKLNSYHKSFLAQNLAINAMMVAESARLFSGGGKAYQTLVREVLRRM